MTVIASVVSSPKIVTGSNEGLPYWNNIGKVAGKGKQIQLKFFCMMDNILFCIMTFKLYF